MIAGLVEPMFVEHICDGVDHNAARCPHHPDQVLVAEKEWCGDVQFVCPRMDYRAILRDPGMHGADQPYWETTREMNGRPWTPPVRQR